MADNSLVIKDKHKSLSAIVDNKELSIEQKLPKVMAWGREYGLQDIESKVEKVIIGNRLWYLDTNHVVYIDKQGAEKKYSLKQFVKVAIKVGDWESQMGILGITNTDVFNILEKMYEKYKSKRTVSL